MEKVIFNDTPRYIRDNNKGFTFPCRYISSRSGFILARPEIIKVTVNVSQNQIRICDRRKTLCFAEFLCIKNSIV